MRHGNKVKKFRGINTRQRSFVRNLVNNLIRREKIETTEARAKAIRPQVERFVTLGKKQTLSARRLLISRLHNEAVAKKVFEVLSPRYEGRQGGYTRIVKLGKKRKRDSAPLATIEFV